MITEDQLRKSSKELSDSFKEVERLNQEMFDMYGGESEFNGDYLRNSMKVVFKKSM